MTRNNESWGDCDYSYEGKRTKTPMLMTYIAISAVFIAGKYLKKAITFLPRKGLEWLANKPSEMFNGYNND